MNQSSHGQNHSDDSNNNNHEQQQNFITLLQDQQKYISIFKQKYQKAHELANQQSYSESSQLFLKCCQMIQVFFLSYYRKIGKNLFKKLSKYWPLCVYLNLAYVYQNDWKIQKTNRYLEKSQEILQILIKEIQKQSKQQFLALTMQLVKLKYQQCAVLSQLNQHQKALSICQSALPLLKQNIQIILNHAKKQYSMSQRQQNQYGVKFGVKVYSFAEQILNNLLSKMLVSCEASKPSTVKKLSSSQFYYWQKNPQRNQKQLRNSFVPPTQKQQTAKRSILGVTKQKTWIDQFNIGYLMKMNSTTLKDWQKSTPLEQYLFKQKIYQYVIYSSVGYFTMATQIRFIDNNKKVNQTQQKCKSKHEQIKKKYGYQQKSQYFALSQSHHLTSISIVTQNIQTLIPYLSHLIKSYDKHYIFKKKLDQIIAIPQQSVLEGSKLSAIRVHSRAVSKASNFGNTTQREAFESIQKLKQNQQEYGCTYHSKSKPKSRISSSSNSQGQYLRQKNTAKSQRKTFNNIYQTYAGLDNSLRHKSAAKMRSVQKLSQTLKPKIKRKNLTQQSINQFKNSIQFIEKRNVKKLAKSKTNIPKKQKQKDKQKEKQKEKQKLSARQSQKKKTFRNNLKQKISLAAYQGQGQLHVKHKSCTSFKLVFKKKK